MVSVQGQRSYRTLQRSSESSRLPRESSCSQIHQSFSAQSHTSPTRDEDPENAEPSIYHPACGTYSVGSTIHTLVYPVTEMDLQDFMHQGRKDDSPNWVRTLTNRMGCLSNALAYIHGCGHQA